MPETPPTYVEQREEHLATGAPAAGRPAGAMGTVVTRRSAYVGDPAYRALQFVWFAIGVVELFLGLRVVFKLMSAHDTGFVSFVYGIAGALAAPFQGIIGDTSPGGHLLEVGTLIAMALYLVAAFLAAKLVRIVRTPGAPAPAV